MTKDVTDRRGEVPHEKLWVPTQIRRVMTKVRTLYNLRIIYKLTDSLTYLIELL